MNLPSLTRNTVCLQTPCVGMRSDLDNSLISMTAMNVFPALDWRQTIAL